MTVQDRATSSVNVTGTDRKIDAPETQSDSPDVHGWQPIETAPKDGTTKVLLWWENAEIGVGWYDRDELWQERKWAHTAMEEGWRCEGDACIPVNQADCTHWMPLPAPPVLP